MPVVDGDAADAIPRRPLDPKPVGQLSRIEPRLDGAPAPVPRLLPEVGTRGEEAEGVAGDLPLVEVAGPPGRARRSGEVLGLEALEHRLCSQPVEVGVIADEPIAPARDVAAVGAG